MLKSAIALTRQRFGLLFTFGVLCASLSLNVVLAWRIKELNRLVPSNRMAGFHPGESMPAMSTVSLDGKRAVLTFDRPTILYVFSPACSWCKKDYPNVLALHARLHAHARFVAVTKSTVGLKEYLQKYPLPCDVFSLAPSRKDGPLFPTKLGVTPQLVVIDEWGR